MYVKAIALGLLFVALTFLDLTNIIFLSRNFDYLETLI